VPPHAHAHARAHQDSTRPGPSDETPRFAAAERPGGGGESLLNLHTHSHFSPPPLSLSQSAQAAGAILYYEACGIGNLHNFPLSLLQVISFYIILHYIIFCYIIRQLAQPPPFPSVCRRLPPSAAVCLRLPPSVSLQFPHSAREDCLTQVVAIIQHNICRLRSAVSAAAARAAELALRND
jgi:hypothetical protein